MIKSGHNLLLSVIEPVYGVPGGWSWLAAAWGYIQSKHHLISKSQLDLYTT